MEEPLQLDIPTQEVDTAMPRLIDGDYPCRVDKQEIVPSKQGEGKHNLLVIFKTTVPAESQKGDSVNAGYPVRKYYPLQQSENPDAPDFRRDLCLLLDAAYNVEDPANRPNITNDTLAGLMGKEVLVKVKLVDDEEYGWSNEVRGVNAIG